MGLCLEVEVEEPGKHERGPNDLDDQERTVLLQPAQVPTVHPWHHRLTECDGEPDLEPARKCRQPRRAQ